MTSKSLPALHCTKPPPSPCHSARVLLGTTASPYGSASNLGGGLSERTWGRQTMEAGVGPSLDSSHAFAWLWGNSCVTVQPRDRGLGSRLCRVAEERLSTGWRHWFTPEVRKGKGRGREKPGVILYRQVGFALRAVQPNSRP